MRWTIGTSGAEMMMVDVQTGPTFHAGPPRLLFRSNAVAGQDYVRYARAAGLPTFTADNFQW